MTHVAPIKYSRPWLADTADRVVSTAAQTAIGVLSVEGVAPSLLTVDWRGLAAVVGAAAVLALLKALALTRTPTYGGAG